MRQTLFAAGALAAFVTNTALAQGPATIPVSLNHLYVVLDSASWQSVSATWQTGGTSFLAKQFAGFENRATKSGTDQWAGVYLYGRHTYVELLAPGANPGLLPGDVGIGLAVESDGAFTRLLRRFSDLGAAYDTLTRKRDDAGGAMPWFHAMRLSGADLPSDHVSFWVMEYTEEMTRYVAAHDSLPIDDRSRDRFIAEKFDTLHLFREVTGATLAVPPDDIPKLRRAFDRAGIMVVTEGEGAIAQVPGFTLRLIPAWDGRGVRRLEFSLIREASANPTFTFGPRSKLQFGPGQKAVWTFIP